MSSNLASNISTIRVNTSEAQIVKVCIFKGVLYLESLPSAVQQILEGQHKKIHSSPMHHLMQELLLQMTVRVSLAHILHRYGPHPVVPFSMLLFVLHFYPRKKKSVAFKNSLSGIPVNRGQLMLFAIIISAISY